MASAGRNSQFGSEHRISSNEHDLRQQDVDEKQDHHHSIPIYNDLELVSESDLSLGAILKGTAVKPLTTFEKRQHLSTRMYTT